MAKINNIKKWAGVLDNLGVDIDDFDITKLSGLGKDSGIEDVLGLFDDSKKDVDKGMLESAIGSFGSLSSLLGDNDDDDDDDSLLEGILGSLGGGGAQKEGGFAGLLGGMVMDALTGDDDKDDKDDDDDSPLDDLLGKLF
jgi:hypothetical protein